METKAEDEREGYMNSSDTSTETFLDNASDAQKQRWERYQDGVDKRMDAEGPPCESSENHHWLRYWGILIFREWSNEKILDCLEKKGHARLKMEMRLDRRRAEVEQWSGQRRRWEETSYYLKQAQVYGMKKFFYLGEVSQRNPAPEKKPVEEKTKEVSPLPDKIRIAKEGQRRPLRTFTAAITPTQTVGLTAGLKGSGKTRLLVSLAASAIKDDAKRVLWLTTDADERDVVQMFKQTLGGGAYELALDGDKLQIIDCNDKGVAGEENFINLLGTPKKFREIIEERNPDLVVLDSWNDLCYRSGNIWVGEHNNSFKINDPSHVGRLISELAKLARSHDFALEMVSESPKNDETGKGSAYGSVRIQYKVDTMRIIRADTFGHKDRQAQTFETYLERHGKTATNERSMMSIMVIDKARYFNRARGQLYVVEFDEKGPPRIEPIEAGDYKPQDRDSRIIPQQQGKVIAELLKDRRIVDTDALTQEYRKLGFSGRGLKQAVKDTTDSLGHVPFDFRRGQGNKKTLNPITTGRSLSTY